MEHVRYVFFIILGRYQKLSIVWHIYLFFCRAIVRHVRVTLCLEKDSRKLTRRNKPFPLNTHYLADYKLKVPQRQSQTTGKYKKRRFDCIFKSIVVLSECDWVLLMKQEQRLAQICSFTWPRHICLIYIHHGERYSQKSRKKTRVQVISPIPAHWIIPAPIIVDRRLKNVFQIRRNIHFNASLG